MWIVLRHCHLSAAVDILLSRFKWRSGLVHLGDKIIYSISFDDHLTDIRDVLTVLRDAGTTLKIKKIQFHTDTVNYQDHIIRRGQLVIEKARLKSLVEAKEPRMQTELLLFFWLIKVYKQFIPNVLDLAAPLHALLR